MSQLTKLSKQFYENTSLKDRKKKGQYFTPKQIKDESLKDIVFNDGDKILENSCGTGEFIHSILERNPNVSIDAYDIDKALVDIVQQNYPTVSTKCEDWLKIDDGVKYDKIIGNPPYFELNKEQATSRGYERFLSYSKSKANIYSFFIIKSIESLKQGGQLIYVVPTSMNNGHSFLPLRQFIIKNCNIDNIKIYSDDDFDNALQNTMTIKLTRLKDGESNNGKFIFKKDKITIFSENVSSIKKLFEGKQSLFELGFEVKTGTYVWNQNKLFMSDNNNDTLLLWACNIENNCLVLSPEKLNKKLEENPKKPRHEQKSPALQKSQWVNGCKDEKRKPIVNKCIIVNRVTGVGNKASIKAALVSLNREFYLENHINYITATDNSKMSLEELHEKLISKETSEILRHILGNTQLSKKELLNLIPIKLDK